MTYCDFLLEEIIFFKIPSQCLYPIPQIAIECAS
jgi:hypothetical protein